MLDYKKKKQPSQTTKTLIILKFKQSSHYYHN